MNITIKGKYHKYAVIRCYWNKTKEQKKRKRTTENFYANATHWKIKLVKNGLQISLEQVNLKQSLYIKQNYNYKVHFKDGLAKKSDFTSHAFFIK